jgi:predicted nucleic acid-binding protein
MIAEARDKGFFPKQGASYLSKHPAVVQQLSDYWINTQKILALNLVLLGSEEKIVVGAQRARIEAGLLTTDSVIVATMREYGVSKIATSDGMFGAVSGLSVFSPTDL